MVLYSCPITWSKLATVATAIHVSRLCQCQCVDVSLLTHNQHIASVHFMTKSDGKIRKGNKETRWGGNVNHESLNLATCKNYL